MIQMAHRPHRTPSAHEKTFLIAAVVLLMPAVAAAAVAAPSAAVRAACGVDRKCTSMGPQVGRNSCVATCMGRCDIARHGL